uniref:Morc S5 domain-containing protein n=1 Tax=Nelumbo nucifera TaxID=4432 RepID=A0A822XLG1_NELNU|nr:TPA_asm: hypothetical protein HUJ06_023917 [Nelumbo nucifera]
MLPKQEKDPINSIAIDSSDDENGIGNACREHPLHGEEGVELNSQVIVPLPSSSNQSQTFFSRSFWKAGDYDVGPTKSTPGPAIAELLDNAVDEICHGATYLKVDKINNVKDNSPALLFQDNGGGMDPESMRKCMSLGYSSKKSKETIGQYGNGFKTSTMRLGADVIVFSRATNGSHATQSVGLLSYTFLRRTGQDDVIVPMVDFELSEHCAEPIIFSSQDDWAANLKIILGWSPFGSKEELMLQFDDIGPHGTKIIIFNLWLNDDGLLELDFDNDDEDIRLRDETDHGRPSRSRNKLIESHISYRIRYSLRAYISILYLRKFTNFHISLRGKPVEQITIADELKFRKVVTYRPQLGMTSKETVSVETTIGFVKEAPFLPVSGFNIYHKCRLIRPFWKVVDEYSSRGNGVVGVLEANFIEPAHDKQDFERSSLFIRLEMKLKQMMLEYWKDHAHLIGLQTPGVRSSRNGCSTEQPPVALAANLQRELPTDQHASGLSANLENEMHLNQPVIGLAANLRPELRNAQPGNDVTSCFQTESPTAEHITGLTSDSSKKLASADNLGSTLVDRICEENIQLFMRCEEYIQKENSLKQTIEQLERDLEEAKRKCSQLSSRLENQRRQKIIE